MIASESRGQQCHASAPVPFERGSDSGGGASARRGDEEAALCSRDARQDAIEELRQEFLDLEDFLREVPTFFIVLTELALRARRDKDIAKIVASREQFWHGRLKGLLERGVSQGVFTAKIDIEAVIASLMVQIKGIAHHVSLSPGGRKTLPVVIEEIADQVVLRLVTPERRARRA